MPDESSELKQKSKATLIEELMLQEEADEIGDQMPLFGPDGLGLDSVDALQLVVALEKHFGLKIPDAEAAKEILASVETIAAEIEKRA